MGGWAYSQCPEGRPPRARSQQEGPGACGREDGRDTQGSPQGLLILCQGCVCESHNVVGAMLTDGEGGV